MFYVSSHKPLALYNFFHHHHLLFYPLFSLPSPLGQQQQLRAFASAFGSAAAVAATHPHPGHRSASSFLDAHFSSFTPITPDWRTFGSALASKAQIVDKWSLDIASHHHRSSVAGQFLLLFVKASSFDSFVHYSSPLN